MGRPSHFDATSTVGGKQIANVDLRADTSKPFGNEVVSSLPTTNLFEGREVYLNQNSGNRAKGKYLYENGGWV